MAGVTAKPARGLCATLDGLNLGCTTMKYSVGVTDNSWFEFLANLKPDEVNFWRPIGKLLRAIEVSSPFVFEDLEKAGAGLYRRGRRPRVRSHSWQRGRRLQPQWSCHEITSLSQMIPKMKHPTSLVQNRW